MSAVFIEAIYQSSSNLYAVVYGVVGSALQVWNTTLNSGAGGWETYASGHWSQYAIALAENSPSGFYFVVFPAGAQNNVTSEVIYLRGGGSPVDTDTAIIVVQSQGDNLAAVSGSPIAAQNMGLAGATQQQGIISAAAGDLITTNLTNTVSNSYSGRLFAMTSGTAAQQFAYIMAYDGSTKIITLQTPLPSTPAPGDAFLII